LKDSVDLLTFREKPPYHEETENNFRGKDGKFSTEKFRESLIDFIENFKDVKNLAGTNENEKPENVSGSGSTPDIISSEFTSVNAKGRKAARGMPKKSKSTYPQGPVTITIYKSAIQNPTESEQDFNAVENYTVGKQEFSADVQDDTNVSHAGQMKKRRPKAVSLNRNVIKKLQK
jgi:hypothetical protein